MFKPTVLTVPVLALLLAGPAPARADNDLARALAAMFVAGAIVHAQTQAAPQRAIAAPQTAGVSVVPFAGPTFRRYDQSTRKAIQRALQRHGFYHMGIDGLWGPGTATALANYAVATGQRHNLDTHEGSHIMMFGLIGRRALE